jgi:arylsulfatase
VEITDPNAAGVLFAHGSRFGGHALFIKDKKLHYVYNFLGIQPEQHFVSSDELGPGKYVLGVEFNREGEGLHKENLGKLKLYVNDKMVAEGPLKTQLGKFSLAGDGLCVGFDSSDAVSQEYTAPAKFKGGRIEFVEVDVDNAQYLDREMELKRALRD